jgi:hypothetical protein
MIREDILIMKLNGGAQLLATAGMPFCLFSSPFLLAKSMTASKSAEAICSASIVLFFPLLG